MADARSNSGLFPWWRGGVMLRKAASRLMKAIMLLIVMFASMPAFMLLSFFVFVAIGEATGWYRPEDYITMSDH
jgi:hypothetical protein